MLKVRMEERRLRMKLEKKIKKFKVVEFVLKLDVSEEVLGLLKVKIEKFEEISFDFREKKNNLVFKSIVINESFFGKVGKFLCGVIKRFIVDSEEFEVYKFFFIIYSFVKCFKEEFVYWVIYMFYCF